jgi:hypothetical protein
MSLAKSKSQYSSPTLELITKVREARATKSPTELYRIALDSLGEAASLGTGSQGLLLVLLREIFEDAIFSSSEFSSDPTSSNKSNKYNKVAHFTLSSRMQQKSEWAQADIIRLKQINQELQEQNGLAMAECASAREELKNELNRQSMASLKIDHLQEQLQMQKVARKKRDDETHQSFVTLTNHSDDLTHRLQRSQNVVKELTAYRDKLESVRVRFHRLTTETNAGEIKSTPESQIYRLVEQLRGLYYDLYVKFEKVRTNVSNTKEHIINMKRKFAKDAGQLIEEKERLTLHANNELATNDVKNLRGVTGDTHKKKLKASLDRLKLCNYGLWIGYVELCESFIANNEINGGCTLSTIDPPNWPHPLPSEEIVHQDILAIYHSISPNHVMNYSNDNDPLPTCVRTTYIDSYMDGKYTSFSDIVVKYFISQYDNERIAISSYYSFLKTILKMKKSGSTRIEMFVRAICGTISIFSIWSYVESMRSLSQIKNQLKLTSHFDRNQAVQLLYGDFASLTEMVDVENHLTVFVRKFILDEEEDDDEKKEDDRKRGEDVETVTQQKQNHLADYDILMEFVCGQLISGNELRIKRSLAALSARDLANSGTMRLTRFQDAVIGMWKRNKKISRKGLTMLYHIIIFEEHGENLFDYIKFRIRKNKEDSKNSRGKSGGSSSDGDNDSMHSDDDNDSAFSAFSGNDAGVSDAISVASENDSVDDISLNGLTSFDVMKYLMGREVSIDNELAQALAFLTWTMVPIHETYKSALDDLLEEEKTKEEQAKKNCLSEKEKMEDRTEASEGVTGLNKVTVPKRKLAPGETKIDYSRD